MTDQQQHTPGPWRTGVPGRGRFSVYSVSAHGRGICVMSNTVESPSDHELNLIADANARLIAAAPGMLAALVGLFEHCAMVHKRWGDNGNQKESDSAIAAARAAIAAATGDSS